MGLVDGESFRYLAMKHDGSQGQTYAMVITWEFPRGKKYAMLNTLDRDALREGLVTVTADQMAKDISATGHVAIYGILFDFDQAVIKPESRPALEQMGVLLKKDSRLNVFIVGHTDNVGTLQHNLDLSQRRADAVVRALTSEWAIDARLLMSRGVGPVAPVASNKTEDGRAKNRRVELVER